MRTAPDAPVRACIKYLEGRHDAARYCPRHFVSIRRAVLLLLLCVLIIEVEGKSCE